MTVDATLAMVAAMCGLQTDPTRVYIDGVWPGSR